MTASYNRAIETNNKNLEADLTNTAQYYDEQKIIINDKITAIKERKRLKREQHNVETNSVIGIQAAIEEVQDEIDSLDRQIVVTKFWTFPSILKILLIFIFLSYLSVFFGSAMYKMFFEEDHVMNLLQKGITPDPTPLLDANALAKTYNREGIFYGVIATLFFLIPVLLTNIKLLTDNKFIRVFIGWVVGIFAVDFVVAILISQYTFEINNLRIGGSGEWDIVDAFETGEFWLIFIFGALPLFIAKMLIQSVWGGYTRSNPELVNREKSLLLRSNKRKLADKRQTLETHKLKLDNVESDIKELDDSIQQLEDQKNEILLTENKKILESREKNDKRNNSLSEIYNVYIASVDSGSRQFLRNIVSGRVSAFKKGYYNFLNAYYAPEVATSKIDSLENVHRNWINQNFD